MNLSELKNNEICVIKKVGGNGMLRQHFLDMGIIPGNKITFIKSAPMGDPLQYTIDGYELTLRKDEAKHILVEDVADVYEVNSEGVKTIKDSKHPGLGEDGIFHNRKDSNPLPDGTEIVFALAGQQNCGKTTLFNALTGSNQHVGNFPGVTVDRKQGSIKGYKDSLVVDLPGIYSMSPYSEEELVSRNFILDENPAGIINIVDATNIERNLYLTMQLMELGKPMVLALNMMDEVRNNGGTIYVNEMERILGIPVIPICAAKKEGVEELCQHAYHVARNQEYNDDVDYCSEEENGPVHRALHGIMHLIEDHAIKSGVPTRFAATKLAEGDNLILERLNLDKNEKQMLEHIIVQMESESGLDRAAAIASMRYNFIKRLCNKTVIKPLESKESIRSQKIDKILTGKFTAIPCFVLVMALIFYLTFSVIGPFLQNLLEMGIEALSDKVDVLLNSMHVNKLLHGLIIDGIFGGVGSVVSFLPIIVVLFLFLSLLEDSGYIARVAFVMDKPLRKLGLSGRSIVPLLIGFGCSVPAVMATRTLTSKRDRIMTILLTPFMSCPAKLPIYAFFSLAFFPNHAGLITVCLYVLGIVMAIIMSLIYRKTLFKGEASPFVMELPTYRFPSIRNTMQLLWEKSKDFLTRAFTVIMLATIVVWILQTFDLHFNVVEDTKDSILANISGLISPIFKPMGLSDWRIITSLITGFVAKESVVSTMNVLIGNSARLMSIMTYKAAAAMLVFSLLYTPCAAAIASIRRELGHKWALFVVIVQCLVAWVASYLVYLIL